MIFLTPYSGSSGPREEVKKGKSSKFNPWNDRQVSPAPNVWSQKGSNLHPKNGKTFHKAKWSTHRKNSPWTWPVNGQTRLVLLRNDQNKIINQQIRNITSTISIFAKTRFFWDTLYVNSVKYELFLTSVLNIEYICW